MKHYEIDKKFRINLYEENRRLSQLDSHDYYIKTNVLLLVDVFDQSENMCLGCYGLYPFDYCNSPRLS